MPFSWINSPSNALIPMFDRRMNAIKSSARMIAQRRAPEAQNWMKDNAIWTDRTGNARQGLAVDVLDLGDLIVLLFVIGRHPGGGFLSYGRFLELANGSQYAIVGPAVEHWAPIIMQDMRALIANG